jgi:hypothetical protein
MLFTNRHTHCMNSSNARSLKQEASLVRDVRLVFLNRSSQWRTGDEVAILDIKDATYWWPSPAQWFFVPTPSGLMAISYCLTALGDFSRLWRCALHVYSFARLGRELVAVVTRSSVTNPLSEALSQRQLPYVMVTIGVTWTVVHLHKYLSPLTASNCRRVLQGNQVSSSPSSERLLGSAEVM